MLTGFTKPPTETHNMKGEEAELGRLSGVRLTGAGLGSVTVAEGWVKTTDRKSRACDHGGFPSRHYVWMIAKV